MDDACNDGSSDDASMVGKATQMRLLAQDRIVHAFRKQLQGQGPGPTDDDLQCFARMALVEEALQRLRHGGFLPQSQAAASDAKEAR